MQGISCLRIPLGRYNYVFSGNRAAVALNVLRRDRACAGVFENTYAQSFDRCSQSQYQFGGLDASDMGRIKAAPRASNADTLRDFVGR